MRLVGYSCRHPEQPLRKVFLPLRDFTVLLGRNDAGKSSLLRAIERDLSGGHYEDTDEEGRRHIGAAFFVEASQGELQSLIVGATNLRQQLVLKSRGHFGSRPPWGLREWKFERLPHLDDEEKEPIAAWLATLRDHGEKAIRPALEALGDSRLVSLEPAGFDRGERVWNVSWCLPNLEGLPKKVRKSLESSRLDPFAAEREKAEQAGGVSISRGLYAAFHGTPRHLFVRGAPVVVAPIGQYRGAHIPRGLAVPIEFDQLHVEVERSINELVDAARHGLETARSEGDPLTPEEKSTRRPPRNWLEKCEGETWRIHPDAEGAAAFIAAAANRVVPDFLGARYELQVSLRRVDRWLGEDGGALELTLRERRDDARIEEFPVEEAADGLRLWIQLALLQACEQAARVGAELHDLAGEWWVYAQRGGDANSAGGEIDDETAEHYEGEFESARRELRAIAAGEKDWPEGHLADALARVQTEDWTRRSARHRRLFIVDEPERHLHPNVQREAANWLRRTTAEQGGLCLLASHSTPFLGLPDGGSLLYVYVRRKKDKGTRCEDFDAGQLRDLDEIVTELGFDRGELLTTVSLFLVVEGIHDVVVLDRLFGELHAARIALLPMEGLANYQAVLDADALWRYTTAKVAICTDKFETELLKEVVSNPKKARALRKSDAPEETKILAKLIGIAERNKKPVYLLGHSGDDLIDILEESVIKSEFPGYPGHAEAGRLWAAEVEGGAKAKQKKLFYEEHFGIEVNVDSYTQLAEAHARAGARPAALQAIVDASVALTRGEVPDAVIATSPY